MLRYLFSRKIADGMELAGLESLQVEDKRGMAKLVGYRCFLGVFTAKAVVVEEELDLVAVAENPHLQRRLLGPIAGNEGHRPPGLLGARLDNLRRGAL